MSNCVNCFSLLDANGVCQRCRFNNATYKPKPHHLPPGSELHNRYIVGKALGEGGFGITYAGYDPVLKRRIAIKEYYPNGIVWRDPKVSHDVQCLSSAASPSYFKIGRQKCMQEAQSLATLDDIPSIVRVIDFFPENNTAYILMEFIEGITLKNYTRKLSRKLTLSEIVKLLKPVTDALEKVHKRGFVHRDISPDNIMITRDGSAKLLDFGAVKHVTSKDGSMTQNPIIKCGFSPPELYSASGKIGPWSDVYALAATFFFLLTGNILDEPTDRLNRDTAGDQLRRLLTTSQTDAMLRALSLKSEARTKSIPAFIQSLSASTPKAPVPSAPKTPAPSAPKAPVPSAPKTPAPSAPKAPAPSAPKTPAPSAPKAPAPVQKPPSANNTTTGGNNTDQRKSFGCWWVLALPLLILVLFFLIIPYVHNRVAISAEESGDIRLAALEYGKAIINNGDTKKTPELKEKSLELHQSMIGLIDGGNQFTVGLHSDGTVAAAHDDSVSSWTNITAVAAGYRHIAALRSDGTVVTNHYASVSDWNNIVAVAAGFDHTVGLQSNGKVVAAGSNDYGQCKTWLLNSIVSVAAGYNHTVGLKEDGTVVAVGNNQSGQCDLSDWDNIVCVAAGSEHTVGLCQNGSVKAVGSNKNGQCNVSDWKKIVAVAAGANHTVGLKSDGTVVATGNDLYGQCSVSGWKDIVAIAAGYNHTVGLKSDGTLVSTGNNDDEQSAVSEWTLISVPRYRSKRSSTITLSSGASRITFPYSSIATTRPAVNTGNSYVYEGFVVPMPNGFTVTHNSNGVISAKASDSSDMIGFETQTGNDVEAFFTTAGQISQSERIKMFSSLFSVLSSVDSVAVRNIGGKEAYVVAGKAQNSTFGYTPISMVLIHTSTYKAVVVEYLTIDGKYASEFNDSIRGISIN